MSYMRGRKYNQRKKSHKEAGSLKASDKMSQATKDVLAEELNVTARTIMRDAKFAQAVDTLSDFKNKNMVCFYRILTH